MRGFLALLLEPAGGLIMGLWASLVAGRQAAALGGLPVDFARIVGYVLGVLLGVYLAGRFMGQRGSLFLTFLGAVLGGLFAGLLSLPAFGNLDNFFELVGGLILSVAILAPVLATIGFNLGTRDFSAA
jgi:hypothetical protein